MDQDEVARPFGVKSGDGRWWWNGYQWLEMPSDTAPEVLRKWPPKGYYRQPGDGRRTYWNGSNWAVPIWRPWRAFATIAVLTIGAMVFFLGALGQMGDPATGASTQAIDRANRLWSAAALAAVPVTIVIVVLLNWHSFRAPIARMKRALLRGTK